MLLISVSNKCKSMQPKQYNKCTFTCSQLKKHKFIHHGPESVCILAFYYFYQLTFLFVNFFNGPLDNLVIISKDVFWEELCNLAQVNGAGLKEKKSSI